MPLTGGRSRAFVVCVRCGAYQPEGVRRSAGAFMIEPATDDNVDPGHWLGTKRTDPTLKCEWSEFVVSEQFATLAGAQRAAFEFNREGAAEVEDLIWFMDRGLPATWLEYRRDPDTGDLQVRRRPR